MTSVADDRRLNGRHALLCLPLLALLSSGASLLAQDASARASAALTQRLAKMPRGAQVGLYVQDVASGETWFAQNADLRLKPASVMKLFTTAAALERFGPEFEFCTTAYVRDGEVWIIGSGDPGLGDERLAEKAGQKPDAFLAEWAERIAAAAGDQSVTRLVLDDTIFDEQLRHSDWPADQNLAWYQAPVAGININDNCLDVGFRVAGRHVEVVARPALPTEFFANHLTLGRRHAPKLTRADGSDVIELRGSVTRAGALEPLTVNRPTVILGHAVRQALAARGIDVERVVRRRIEPAAIGGAPPVLIHKTPLRDVLWRCNTFSQNLFAECLVKSLAAYGRDGRPSGVPGSWEGGQRVLREELGRLGVDLSAAELRDGSGLSHLNRVTAAQIVSLLRAMRQHRHAAVFVESLAQPGEDGSMKRRFADAALRGRVRAKTGTLRGVSTLAGYVTRADGKVLAFALLVNGDGGEALAVDVCRTLVGP